MAVWLQALLVFAQWSWHGTKGIIHDYQGSSSVLTANEICKLFNKQEIWRLLIQNYGNKLSKICKTTLHLEKRSFGRFEFCAFVDTPEYPRLKFSCINFIKVNYTLNIKEWKNFTCWLVLVVVILWFSVLLKLMWHIIIY